METHGVTSLREIPRYAATVSQKRSQECMVQLPSVQFLGVWITWLTSEKGWSGWSYQRECCDQATPGTWGVGTLPTLLAKCPNPSVLRMALPGLTALQTKSGPSPQRVTSVATLLLLHSRERGFLFLQNDCALTRKSQLLISFNYLFIWLHQVLFATCGIFSSSMWTLSWDIWDLGPWPGFEPGPSALGARSVKHWSTREVPAASF